MGTRGAFGFRHKQQDYVTYCHFDSYPDGLGSTMAKFVMDNDMDRVRTQVEQLELVDQHGSQPTPQQIQRCKDAGLVDTSVSTNSEQDWYCLLREGQGDPGALLNVGYMIDSAPFLEDSLFCEWAYIVNLDDGVFEVYEGFQQKRHNKGRYAKPKQPFHGTDEYQPVALIKEIPFDELPEEWPKFIETK